MIYALRFVLIVLYTIFWAALACLLVLFDRSGEIAVRIGRIWVSWILGTCGIRVEAEGAGDLVAQQPVVIMSNHQSHFDIPALVATLPISWRFVAKRELTWLPFFGWALVMGGHVIIDRSRQRRAIASLERAAARVRAGTNVIIFPEGTRSRDGALGAFKSGGFHLARRAGVPIVPASISGSREIHRRGSLAVHGGTIRVRYGAPVPTAGRELRELEEAVRSAIEAGLRERPAPGH